MTDEHQDDEVLGRALARAIETQDTHETPYERSRIAARSARRPFPLWQTLAVAATLVLAIGYTTWLARPGEQLPVAASPSPTTASATAAASPSRPAGAFVATRVFFVRDLLPPVSAILPSGGAHIPVDSIAERIAVAHSAAPGAVPQGALNPLASVDGYDVSIAIDGDTATVAFKLPRGWGVHGATQVQALVQQLVYVITEEPTIRKARILESGKANAVIDGLLLDRPLTREDVTDYAEPGSRTPTLGYGDAKPTAARKLSANVSVDASASLGRLTVTTDLRSISPTVLYPDFRVEALPNDETAGLPGKWRLVLTVNGDDTTLAPANVRTMFRPVDGSPVVGLRTTWCAGCGTSYELGLDDLRPWRTAVAYDPFRIIVDVGGDPRMIVAKNAVYAPTYGATVGRSFDVTGVAHNFEANVVIRVKDERDNVVLQTSTTATNCCDPGGTFTKTVTLPQSVSGRVFLEVYEASAKDGSDLSLIRIPLAVR